MDFKQSFIAFFAIAGIALALPAAADDSAADDGTTIVVVAAAPINADKVSRDRANTANKRAAERAVEAVLSDVKLDLDIRLIGPTSKKIASDR